MILQNNIKSLLRIDRPIPILLLFVPTWFGICIGGHFNNLRLLFILICGTFLARSMGCVINDIFDADIDKMVLRTKNRPLASNNMTKKQAMIIFCMLSVLCFLCALFLHIKSIMISILSFVMIVFYPLCKRLFMAPQVFLGVTFNMAVFIAFFSSGSSFCYDLIPWFFHAMFFTIFYDVIYAFSDVKCDAKINNNSLSVIVYPVYKNFLFWVAIIICLLPMLVLKTIFLKFLMIFPMIHFMWQINNLDMDSKNDPISKFKSNVYVGIMLCIICFLNYF